MRIGKNQQFIVDAWLRGNNTVPEIVSDTGLLKRQVLASLGGLIDKGYLGLTAGETLIFTAPEVEVEMEVEVEAEVEAEALPGILPDTCANKDSFDMTLEELNASEPASEVLEHEIDDSPYWSGVVKYQRMQIEELDNEENGEFRELKELAPTLTGLELLQLFVFPYVLCFNQWFRQHTVITDKDSGCVYLLSDAEMRKAVKKNDRPNRIGTWNIGRFMLAGLGAFSKPTVKQKATLNYAATEVGMFGVSALRVLEDVLPFEHPLMVELIHTMKARKAAAYEAYKATPEYQAMKQRWEQQAEKEAERKAIRKAAGIAKAKATRAANKALRLGLPAPAPVVVEPVVEPVDAVLDVAGYEEYCEQMYMEQVGSFYKASYFQSKTAAVEAAPVAPVAPAQAINPFTGEVETLLSEDEILAKFKSKTSAYSPPKRKPVPTKEQACDSDWYMANGIDPFA